jgi:YVTN family beta-propeller protein
MEKGNMAGNKVIILLVLFAVSLFNQSAYAAFTAFESGQVRPIAQSPDGSKLFVVNTPDNQLEIFNVNNGSPTYVESVTVGLEPVAVAAYSNGQVWVVNYLSDSISIIDVSTSPARVIKTLLVGDEPADIVFAGTNDNRAFITTAHRGQNSPYTDPNNPGELITPGIGRADVWVFDATNTGSSLGGDPVAIVTLFGDTPKALAVSPDGKTVYAAVFKSGNQTTVLHEEVVCNSGDTVPCTIKDGEVSGVGKLPTPNPKTISSQQSPETGLIVKYNGSQWVDELNTDWSSLVRFNLPDKDVFAIDADALIPVETASFANVGTVLFNMAVNPVSGKIYVANTEAVNEVRFEGAGTASTTVQGHLHEARITVIDPGNGTVNPVHLNKHIDYSVTPAPAGISDNSLATPKGIAVTADGNTLYVVAKSSGKIGVFNTTTLENDSFTPDSANHINLSAGGPGGLLLDETNNRIYVTTRFDNAISVIDTTSATEISHIGLHNPEPPSIIAGRQFLYDAQQTSSNGEASCASCHIEGDKDELAWDLGDPDGSVITNNNPFALAFSSSAPFHPMKGPMTTQTLRGMNTHGPMHWRGDRSGANSSGVSSDALDEDLAFKTFNVAFEGLLGRAAPLTPAQMQAYTDFILQVTPPPNPIRALDNSLTSDQQAGSDYYLGAFNSDQVTNCNGCHTLDPASGFFGTAGLMSFEGALQDLKVPQLRNMYEKVGMFGMADIPFNNSGDNGHKGDQIRGFGYTHDGAVDTLERFHNAVLFDFTLSGADPNVLRKQMVQFMFAYDSNLKPIVGQQVTLSGSGSGAVLSRIDLLIARALAGDADLIVKMTIAGEQRGAIMSASDNFQTDKVSENSMTALQIRNIAQTAGQEVTYTAVPPGSGTRLAIDRDGDGVLNNDDNCPANANPGQQDDDLDGVGNACEPPDFDGDGIQDALDNCTLVANASQLDTDNDGAGDACDTDDDNDGLTDSQEQAFGTNSLLADTDGDNLNDGLEVNTLGTNPLLLDTDGDGYNDDVEVNIGSNPLDRLSIPADGDINGDNAVNVIDALLATQIALGFKTPTADELLRGDVAPLTNGAPNPNGAFDTGDLVLIQRKVFGLVNF